MSLSQRGRRPIRIANCSGACSDPGYQMHRAATLGPVDIIVGDYLAELNLAWNSRAYSAGQNPGYERTAKDGLLQTLSELDRWRIKVIINGGGLNPRGLAEEIDAAVKTGGYALTVAWVDGDNVISLLPELQKRGLVHIDGREKFESFDGEVVTAHAYLGSRGIVKALEDGADIVICGRVADAAPVVAAAQWWFGWEDTEYARLAHALVAGHLVECSAYATGANFCGFGKYPLETFVDIGFPIVEVEESGVHTVTKHAGTGGMVNRDTVRCQLLYELQGNIYLNSDVMADLRDVEVDEIGRDRVRVSGIQGRPPPPTTKLALFLASGYQCELTINATGTPLEQSGKYALFQRQLEHALIPHDFTLLQFQRIGQAVKNPRSQLAGTTSLRVFAQASTAETAATLAKAFNAVFMQHFSGMHCSMDLRSLSPKPFLTYFPAVMEQAMLHERAHIFGVDGRIKTVEAGHPPVTAPVAPRENYDPAGSPLLEGPTELRPLGEIALARSGDKGANVNIGLFTCSADAWDWLRLFMTRKRMQELMGEDWQEGFVIERVEFPRIWAVHFVVYGALGRGVSSSPSLDGLGKGFADFVRARYVPIPSRLLKGGPKARL